MNLDTQQLLLAAELRKIAIELRETAAAQAVPSANDARGEKAARQDWKSARPVATFVPDALEELQAIVSLLK